MPVPTSSRPPRGQPDHLDEHLRLAQLADRDKPQGVVAYKLGSLTNQALSATAYRALQLTSVALKANRFYIISFAVRALQTGTTAGTFTAAPMIDTTNLTSVHAYLPASRQYVNYCWSHIYCPTADATVTVGLDLYGPTGSACWLDRGGFLMVEDRGCNRGKQ